MSTDIVQVDERPLSTVTIGNQVAHYHELTEAEVSTALHKLSRIEIAILNLAAGGMGGSAICEKVGIKRATFSKHMKKPLFHDCYYTVRSSGFTSDNIREMAHAKAANLVEHLNDIATMSIDEDTKPAQLAVAVNATKELLTLGGLYKGVAPDPPVNIGQLLVSLATAGTPQWKR